MKKMHDTVFPNESAKYRTARSALLKAEIRLRRELERVAALRRKLPPGGRLKADYIFDEMPGGSNVTKTKFSDLFDVGKNTLIVYSFMFPNATGKPCPACTSIQDGLNGSVPHIRDRVNYVVIAKAPIDEMMQWAGKRGWKNLRILSSEKNSYNKDYLSENEKGEQIPILNVFRKTPKGIFHFYGTELFFAKSERGQDPRHVDLIWPIWNMFDLTPEGRGGWFPKYSYKK
jgi:predicted dithiol-disulfide oxidoreductase (DUF899 family)